MVEFLKKMMEWALNKEEEMAKECKIDPEEVDNQIKKVLDKKDELEKKCKEELSQIDKLIDRLEKIKQNSSSCESGNE